MQRGLLPEPVPLELEQRAVEEQLEPPVPQQVLEQGPLQVQEAAAAGAGGGSDWAISNCSSNEGRSDCTTRPVTSARISPTNTTAAADAANRTPSTQPALPPVGTGCSEIANERVAWISGS